MWSFYGAAYKENDLPGRDWNYLKKKDSANLMQEV
jgi:hypothetical protein